MKFFFHGGLLSLLLITPRLDAYYTGSNFAQMLREYTENKFPFVDKTMFIRDFISSSPKYMIITRPHKWGKTLNLDMLHKFLAIETDRHGLRIDDEEKTYKPMFREGNIKVNRHNRSDEKYPRLKIADCPSVIEKNLGKWPVLKLDFSKVTFPSCKSITESELAKTFLELVQKTFDDVYRYLGFRSNKQKLGLSYDEKVVFYTWVYNTFSYSSTEKCQEIVKILVKAFYNFFEELPIYILIDGYDSIVNQFFFEEQVSASTLNITAEFFETVLSTFQHPDLEQKVKKVLMTGTLPYLQTRSHSKLNTYHLISVTDDTFAEYYGFTRTEVETLTQVTPKLENRHTVFTNIIDWYNGYQIGNVKVLNPWSVRASLYKKGETNIQWKYTDQFADIYTKNAITNEELRHAFELMISTNGTIPSPPFSKPFGYTDLRETKASFSLLLHQGLLTADRVFVDGRTVLRYSIPNRETHDLIYQEILHYEMKNLGAVYEDLIIRSKNPITYLTQAKIALFENNTRILLNTYCPKLTIERAESFHWLIEALIFPALYDRYRVISERNADSGGTFWRLIPIRRTDCAHLPVVILGYKFVNSEYELVSACKKVINEIIAKNYIGDIEVGSRAVYYVGTAVSKWKHFKVLYACPLRNGTLFQGENGNEEGTDGCENKG